MRVINVNDLLQYIEYLGAKEVSGGFISPAAYNNLLSVLVNKMVLKYYGIPEQYQPGMPMPGIAYEITQAITDYLSFLKVELPLNVPPTGKITLPSDYLHKSSAVATVFQVAPENLNQVTAECCHSETVQIKNNGQKKYIKKWYPVTFVPEQERWTWLNSDLMQPTAKIPIATFIGNDELQFYPADIKTVLFVYLRYPKKPVWAYTIVKGAAVYNPIGSVDIELPEILMDELAVTILQRLGISIRENAVISYANYVKDSGK